MNYLKRIITAVVLAGTVLMPFAQVAEAVVQHSASGKIEYNAYGLERYASFDVKQTNSTCTTTWNVTGNYVITFLLNGNPPPYAHDASFTQSGSSVGGTGGYPTGGPYTYTWHVTSGTVTSNTVNLTILYDLGATGTVMNMTGSINPNGTMTGTWSDNFGGSRSGTWSTTSGTATGTGCAGKGEFKYADDNKDGYIVNVTCISINANTATFSGKVTKASNQSWKGLYLIARAVDNSPDTISGSFVSSDPHCNTSGLVDGPFTILFGNIKVQ